MNGPIHFEPEPGARADAEALQVPKPALIMAAALIAVVFALAISARIFGFGAFAKTAPVAVLAERQLTFTDTQEGGIIVGDAATNTVAMTLPPASNGFLRGVLRALTRSRKLAGAGAQVPFRLVRYVDGTLVLIDPTNNHTVTVSSFGETQIEAFDKLLVQAPAIKSAVP